MANNPNPQGSFLADKSVDVRQLSIFATKTNQTARPQSLTNIRIHCCSSVDQNSGHSILPIILYRHNRESRLYSLGAKPNHHPRLPITIMAAITADTPLAEALSTTIHQRIVEESWTTEEDTALAEYIVLMLANGKTQDQVASELAGELLQDAQGTEEFSRWLFEQVAVLSGGQAPAESISTSTAAALEQSDEPIADADSSIPAAYDADMGDSAPDNAYVSSRLLQARTNVLNRPKGPRGMQSGRGARGGRGSIAKPDSALHRVRGNDRINTHVRGAPKGPRSISNQPVRPGMQKALNGMMGQPQPGQQMPMMQNGMPPGQQMGAALTPEQQMQYMQMFEQQAQMMAQMMQMNQNMQGQQNGNRALFDRVDRGRGGGRGGRGRGAMHQNGTTRNSTSEAEPKEGESQVDGQSNSQPASNPNDPFTIMCKFNTRCTNATCPYVHQSPAAPLNTPVDMTQTCNFGVTCKNHSCIARHPSPAQKSAHQAQEQCKFWPNCTKPNCPFRHPQASLCSYGASCKTENCKFTHLETMCRYNPCSNARCPYKHTSGQNRGFEAYTWTPGKKNEEKQDGDHVSDRKFVDGDAGPEELVKPDGAEQNGNGVKDEAGEEVQHAPVDEMTEVS